MPPVRAVDDLRCGYSRRLFPNILAETSRSANEIMDSTPFSAVSTNQLALHYFTAEEAVTER